MKQRATGMWLIITLPVLLAACGQVPTTPIPTNPSPFEATPLPPTEEPTPIPTETVPLAAMVNGQPILLADYERQVAQYEAAMVALGQDPASPEGQARLEQARQQVLNWMIERVLIEQAAAEAGVVVTGEEVEAALEEIIAEIGGEEVFQARLEADGLTREDVLRELGAEMIGAVMVERITAQVPETAEHVHARHVLVDTAEEAQHILAQLQAGADFAAQARNFSQDNSTRQAGGDLGFFPRGVLMAPEVEEAAFSLEPGQLSGVVASSFGFHIVQVVERDPDRPLSPENLQILRERAFQSWVEALWAQASVERYIDLEG